MTRQDCIVGTRAIRVKPKQTRFGKFWKIWYNKGDVLWLCNNDIYLNSCQVWNIVKLRIYTGIFSQSTWGRTCISISEMTKGQLVFRWLQQSDAFFPSLIVKPGVQGGECPMHSRNWPKFRMPCIRTVLYFSYLIMLGHTAYGFDYCHSNIVVLIPSPEPAPGLVPQCDCSIHSELGGCSRCSGVDLLEKGIGRGSWLKEQELSI